MYRLIIMASRLGKTCRCILSRDYYFMRFKLKVGIPGTGLCTLRYHSNNLSNIEASNSALSNSKENVLNKFEWLTKKTPMFGVSGDNITVLHGPVEFYEELKSQAWRASHRVVLASLYLGTSPKVQELVDTLYTRCQESQTNPDKSELKMHILLDCTRGSRGKHNSRTMLLPLLKDFPGMTSVSLYHTPDLRGILKRFIPERFNEIIGLSHIKAYVFDDTVIMSGANLSESYFTNRQDRYIMIKDCPQLADFFHKLIATVSSFSFQLQSDDNLVLDPDFNIHPYEGTKKHFVNKARTSVEACIDPKYWNQDNSSTQLPRPILSEMSSFSDKIAKGTSSEYGVLVDNRTKESRTKPLIFLRQDAGNTVCQPSLSIHTDTCDRQHLNKSQCNNQSNTQITHQATDCKIPVHDGKEVTSCVADTWIFPLVQMGPLGITVDEEVTSQILRDLNSDMKCFLTSGYFNLTRKYMDIILNSKARFDILMASPQVNGFYGSKGISGYVPDSYTYIAKKFCERLDNRGQHDRIHLFEYYRGDWTFHAKGLWIYLAGEQLPSVTLMGSPNFGHRSVHRDLEAQLAVVTTNENLQKQLHQEQQRLYASSEVVNQTTYQEEHRKVPLWVKIVSTVTQKFW